MSDLSEEIREIKEELQEVKDRNRELEQKIEGQGSGKDSSESTKDDYISRRQFLKMAGLGAGALGLSSATSAWSILQPSSQGTSDIDAQSLQGLDPSEGSSGQVLATDGSSPYWNTPASSPNVTAEQDDLSDVTRYDDYPANQYDARTVVDISGSGTLISGFIEGVRTYNDGPYIDITVDGNTTRFTPTEGSGEVSHHFIFPPISFESSLNVYYETGGNDGSASVWVKQ